MFQTKAATLKKIYILCCVPVFYTMSNFCENR